MKGYWENLRPFEKRVVVGVAALFFVVLNFLFVFPYFSEWGKIDERMFQARRKLALYQNEVGQTNTYWREVRKMEQEGLEVPPEDQTRHFNNTINAEEGKNGVQPISGGRVTSTTNQFFIELSSTITVQSPEQPLVNFLHSLGAGNSLIRVRDLNLRPELPARQQLQASVTLVASYQKKMAGKPATPSAPGAPARAAASKPPGSPGTANLSTTKD